MATSSWETSIFSCRFTLFLACASTFAATLVHAQTQPTEDSLWYYEIGGAQVVPKTMNPHRRSLSISGSMQLGLGYSCGNFDPVLGVAETLNQVKTGADDMLRAMTDAATGAIASLPALILQRANPGLYELMQNALVGAKLKVDLATKDCRQMEAEIAQGKNPYRELVVLSKGNDWKREMSIGGTSAVQTQQKVEIASGANGVPWVLGQPAGGNGQAPLQLTGDIVQAGYNATLNRHASQTAPAPTTVTGSLGVTWPSPQDASTWVVEVIGEQTVATCAGCTPKSIPGHGLLPVLEKESNQLAQKLELLVNATSPPTRTDLTDLAGPNFALTREVVEALRELPTTERIIVQTRLVNDIAISRVLEKSFFARRLLITGRQLPEVVGNGVASRHVADALADLDAETERLLFEYRARQQVTSDAVAVLLRRVGAMRTAGRGIPELGPVDNQPIIDGRVRR